MIPITTIYLIRHAEAEGNLYRRIHGHYDALVTDNGFLQIKALEERFRDISIDAVYSSDLYRTRATARSIYLPKCLELHTDPGLREINLGDWEDHPWGEIRHIDPAAMAGFNNSDPAWVAPSGESLGQAGQRIIETLHRIAQRHPNQTIAVFSHGTAIRQALSNIKGLSPEQWRTMGHSDNTAVTCLIYENGQFAIQLEGDNSHLDESISTLARQAWWRKAPNQPPDINLWFRPIDWEAEQQLYLQSRSNAWHCTHVNGPAFDGEGFLRDAQEHLSHSPWGVTVAMDQGNFAGIIQVDTQRYKQDNAGYIPFCFVRPELRDKNLGIQLIGQAVSFFRPLGRDKLRLRCAPYNTHAQHFYAKYGFVKIGEETGSRVPLDILEKYIGYER